MRNVFDFSQKKDHHETTLVKMKISLQMRRAKENMFEPMKEIKMFF